MNDAVDRFCARAQPYVLRILSRSRGWHIASARLRSKNSIYTGHGTHKEPRSLFGELRKIMAPRTKRAFLIFQNGFRARGVVARRFLNAAKWETKKGSEY